MIVSSPPYNRAVLLEAQVVELGRRDGHEAAVGCGDIAQAVVVISPSHDRAILLETQTVTHTRLDGNEALRQVPSRHLFSPTDDTAGHPAEQGILSHSAGGNGPYAGDLARPKYVLPRANRQGAYPCFEDDSETNELKRRSCDMRGRFPRNGSKR